MIVKSSQLQNVINLLRTNRLTLSFAESCTGGRLSATLAAEPGISDIFMGSVVSYSNEVKMDLLGVRRDSILNQGAVSSEVALQMAQGVRAKLKTLWSVSVTGIAGPTGGSQEKPVGTVWFAVSGPDFDQAQLKQFSGDRSRIQEQSVEYALEFLAEVLKTVTMNN